MLGTEPSEEACRQVFFLRQPPFLSTKGHVVSVIERSKVRMASFRVLPYVKW